MISPKKIVVVIPNWNGLDFLGECLDSLLGQSYKDFQIVVVDNGSADGSKELVQTKYPSVHLIPLDRNYGFSGGVNPGIKYALKKGAEFVALFNNDAIADKDWLENLMLAAERHNNAGTITCKFLKLDRKTIDSTGDFYSIWGRPFPRGRDEIDHGQFDGDNWVFGGTGGASLYRTQMLKQIGTFDEDFFAYFEDVDLAFRAQLAGWKAYYEPSAKAYHHVGGTSSKMGDFARFHSTKNFVYLYVKNMPGGLFWKFLPAFTWGEVLFTVNSLAHFKFKAFFAGWWQVMLKTPATLAKRHQIQSHRQVDPAYIDQLLWRKTPPNFNLLTSVKRLFGIKPRLAK